MKRTRINCPDCGERLSSNRITHHYRSAHDNADVPADAVSLQRFNQHWVLADNGCHEWTGQLSKDGYGKFAPFNAYYTPAYRWRYMLEFPDLDYGNVYMDHLCRNRRCVNIEHLEPTTPRGNILRGETLAAANIAKTHCNRGHEFNEENTYSSPTRPSHRQCKKCRKITDDARKVKRGKK